MSFIFIQGSRKLETTVAPKRSRQLAGCPIRSGDQRGEAQGKGAHARYCKHESNLDGGKVGVLDRVKTPPKTNFGLIGKIARCGRHFRLVRLVRSELLALTRTLSVCRSPSSLVGIQLELANSYCFWGYLNTLVLAGKLQALLQGKLLRRG
jgi:hypothetical protein